jgi:hypothetical protein
MPFKTLTLKNLFAATALLALPAGIANAQTISPTTPSNQPSAAATQADATAGEATATTDATAQAGAVQAATKADIKAGVAVVDQAGAPVGKVESVTASGAVVSTGAARVQIPLESFGKNEKGLVIAMSKTQLEAAAKGS